MMLAHLGSAVFICGVTMVKTYEVERDVNMAVGDTTEISDWVFTFRGVREVKGPNYTAEQGLVVLSKNGREVAQLRPESTARFTFVRDGREQEIPITVGTRPKPGPRNAPR